MKKVITTGSSRKEVDMKTLKVFAQVNYWEDATVNGVEDRVGDLIPCRGEYDLWCPEIDIDSGRITNWKKGVIADIHYKVSDCGDYALEDEKGNSIVKREDSYVPKALGDGDGNYIIMNVDEDGFIKDWKFDTLGLTD